MRQSILHSCLAVLILGSITMSAAARPAAREARFARATEENMDPLLLANAWIEGHRQAHQDPNLLAINAILEIASLAPIEGRQPVVTFTDDFYGAIGDRAVTVETIVAQGNQVSAVLRIEGHHAGTLLGVPATGRWIDVTLMGFIEARDGRITHIRIVLDTYGLLQQIGALPRQTATGTA